MIELSAFAKINWFLDIENKRDDGYHNIVSVMQTIDWCDKIGIEKIDGPEIQISCFNASIPTDGRNTAYKAAALFLDTIEKCDGVHISIEKNIPHAAGLAGGSADAAAVLRGLNRLYDNALSEQELLAMGAKIGADVPFCMIGGTQLTTGIGDKMSSFPSTPPCFFVCVKDGEGISTPKAYAALDQKYNDFKEYRPRYERLSALRNAFDCESLSMLTSGMFNVFEQIAEQEHSSVKKMKQILMENGAYVAMMSGSGPSVFGVFGDCDSADRACAVLKRMGATCKTCVPISGIEWY